MKSWKVYLYSMLMFAFVAWAAGASAEKIVIGYSGPLSGPAAEFGQDCLNGVDMAINELNAGGGVTIKGNKYTFKLEKLDDRVDATQAKNNTIRFISQYKSPIVFNPIATTIGAMMSIPQTPGTEFIIAGYTSIHNVLDKGHPMIITPTPNFLVYANNMANVAWERGWKKCAMVVTLGGYGDAWRKAFKHIWVNKGGQIVGDFPANYFTETDFSSQLASALVNKPDFLLIGGPSSTTALVVEQARNMGFKGGLVMIDQAKPERVAKLLNNVSLLEGMIGTAACKDLPLPATAAFSDKYKAAYKRDMSWECALNYSMMHLLAKAMKAADSIKAVDIRRNVYKGLPALGDKYPNELFGIADNGVMYTGAVMQYVVNGKFSKVDYVMSFPKTRVEFDKYKKMSKSPEPERIRWLPVQ